MPTTTRTRITAGDIRRELQIGRAVLERLLRDYGHEFPPPEVVGGSRVWPVEVIEDFKRVLARDREGRR